MPVCLIPIDCLSDMFLGEPVTIILHLTWDVERADFDPQEETEKQETTEQPRQGEL